MASLTEGTAGMAQPQGGLLFHLQGPQQPRADGGAGLSLGQQARIPGWPSQLETRPHQLRFKLGG